MQRKVKSNTTEKNSRKSILVLLFCSFALLVGGIATAVIIPYASTLPMYISASVTYNTNLLNEETELNMDGQLVFTSSANEKIIFSSSQANVSMGDYNTKEFLYCDKDNANSDITISFSIESLTYKDVAFEINVCTEDGNNITKVDPETYEIVQNEDVYSTTIASNSNIFINSVTVTYKKRVK